MTENLSLVSNDQLATARANYHSTENSISGPDEPNEDEECIEESVISSSPSVEDEHCHDIETELPEEGNSARKVLIWATVICILFMIAEIVGGLLAGSLAILTDAAHLLTDVAGFLISLFALFLATNRPTRKMNFGWHRAEVLGAMLSVLLIWVVTAVLVYTAVQRIISGKYEINAVIMLITAGLGVIVNIILGIILHRGGHSHSHGGGGGHGHGHSHSSHSLNAPPKVEVTTSPSGPDAEKAESPPKELMNINVKAAFVHVIGDFVQSIGVFVAALVIYFKPSAQIADPICTFIFSALVLITTLTIMRDALHVLMEGIPRQINFADVMDRLQSIEGVVKVHDLRIWALTMNKIAASVHLAVEADSSQHQTILRTSIECLRKNFNIYHATIQIEEYKITMADCVKCEVPKK